MKLTLVVLLAAVSGGQAILPVPRQPGQAGLPLLHWVLPKAKVPFVAADGRGGFYVSHVADGAFRVAHVRDGKWSAARTITSDAKLLVNSADHPSIAVDGKRLLASWSTRNAHGTIVHLAESKDGGATWSKATTPHPRMVSMFGFVSLLPEGAVFLDGRGLPGGMEGAGDMQLRTAGALLDPRVCDCCQTAATMTSAGAVVAYRDRSEKEIRDISVVRQTAKGWTAPKTLHADGWQINGCPVNGPQLDARGRRVAAAWFTAAQNAPRVQVAFSNDAGATFSAPLRVAERTMGRVDVAWVDDRSVVVTYVSAGALHARRVSRDGTMGAPVKIAAAGGFPRLAVSKENAGVVWSADDGVHFQLLEGVR